MTENEAIKILDTEKHCLDKSTKGLCKINCGDCKANIPIAYQEKSYEVAITAIKEVQKYREIGTVEECREAVEKQKAKELVYESNSVFSNGFSRYRMGRCPMCDRYYNSSDEVNYCSKCGQALMNENLEGMEDESSAI